MSNLGAIPLSGTLLAPIANSSHQNHCAHSVQLYSDDAFLLDSLAQYVGSALGGGDAAVVIATAAHREGLALRLAARGLDIARARQQGRYIALDAAETLSSFMRDGKPDANLFTNIIGETLERACSNARRPKSHVVAFGEMVMLLWMDGNPEAALQLEKLWNNLSMTHSFSLRCAYPLGAFNQSGQSELFRKMCAEHSEIIPEETYTLLTNENQRLRQIADLQYKARAFDTESALRLSEERFRLLVESVQDYAIFMLDSKGYIATWNIGAERIKGYKASEIVGKHFSTFYSQEDIRSGKPKWELEVAAKDGRLEDEGWRLRKDGSRFWANVVITALRGEDGELRGFSKVTRDVTERMLALETIKQNNKELKREIIERIAAEQKLHASEESLRKLSGHLLRMQDEERRRLGRELHDSIGQYLAAVKMGLDALAADIRKQTPGLDANISECIRLVEESIKEVRTQSYLLYPPMLEEMGLQTAIPWYLEGFTKRSSIQTTFEISPDFGRLPRDVELAIFRILQESLTNVHRHSQSLTAQIRVRTEDGAVCMEISDQGKGIPPGLLQALGDASVSLGVGLRGMQERVKQLGGTLELSSDKGATVRVTIPCETQTEAPAEAPRIAATQAR